MTERMSHSRGRTIGECGHRYFLKYRAQVPEAPSWALVGGRAFHSWCQDYELAKLGGDTPHHWAYYLGMAVGDEVESSGTRPESWRATGKLKSRPNGEDFSYWLDELGPKMIELYQGYDWGDWRIAHTIPDGHGGLTAGIEYPLHLDTWHGYVDQIREDNLGNLLAVDLKTGKRMYKTTQLEEYGAAGKKLGLRIVYGGYYNARKGEFDHKPLRWTVEQFDEYVAGRHTMATSGLYLPNVGDHCGWCPVRDHCKWG
jgi:PD-(D/E)XK nuclease superfamily